MTRAVCFDVDFTLIYPGPTFRGEGYQQFCASHGMSVDPSRFNQAVASASFLLDEAQESFYDPKIFIHYTRHIIEQMGGMGPSLDACAKEIYDEWAACQHFSLYEEVPGVLQDLAARGVKIGLISNTHRCLTSFQTHFELNGLIDVAISSSDHGYMKPHPSIFEKALNLLRVKPREAVMVGDSIRQDIDGARRIGMRAVLVKRSNDTTPSGQNPLEIDGVPVIKSLRELSALL
jgi:putative hydrolase of the HAD superfamily